jgi:hypothetical protein
MPARRLSDTRIVIGTAVLTVVLAAFAAFITPPGAGAARGSSSFSQAAGGGQALYRTLEAAGYDVRRSFEPVTSLQADPARTSLILTGHGSPSDLDRLALRAFIEAGGIAILVGAPGADFIGVAGVAPPDPVVTSPSVHRVLAASPLAAGAPEITMTPGQGEPTFDATHVAVFAVSPVSPLVSTARIGRGRVVWLASPTPLENLHVGSAGNLRFLLNALGPRSERTVIWDEHYHGHSRSLWSYAAGTPLPWIAAQAGLVVVAMVVAYSRRSGPVRPRATDPRSSPMEFIDMLRALYKRAGASNAAVRAARGRFTRAVTSTCGLPSDSSHDAIARAVAPRVAASNDDVLQILVASDRAAHDRNLPSGEALRLTQRLQRLTNALTTERRQTPAPLGD